MPIRARACTLYLYRASIVDASCRRTVKLFTRAALFPLIAEANQPSGLVDIFTAFGGAPPWEGQPHESCLNHTSYAACEWICDDQVHPTAAGYVYLAEWFLESAKALLAKAHKSTCRSDVFVMPFFLK